MVHSICHNYDKEMVDYVHFENSQTVRLGDNRVVQALVKGNIWLDIKDENDYNPARLVDFLYVPDLAKNPFSVSAAGKRGYTIELQQIGCVILYKFRKLSRSGKLKITCLSLMLMKMRNIIITC